MGKNPAAGSLCYPTVTQLTDASVYEKEPKEPRISFTSSGFFLSTRNTTSLLRYKGLGTTPSLVIQRVRTRKKLTGTNLNTSSNQNLTAHLKKRCATLIRESSESESFWAAKPQARNAF
jgi:hypothetical protein